MDPIFQIGKSSMTPEFTKAIDEALAARELIKISVHPLFDSKQRICTDDEIKFMPWVLFGQVFHSLVRAGYFFPLRLAGLQKVTGMPVNGQPR